MGIQKDYKKTKVNKINQGTYFKLKPTDTAPVWVRDHFDRAIQTLMPVINMKTQIMRHS